MENHISETLMIVFSKIILTVSNFQMLLVAFIQGIFAAALVVLFDSALLITTSYIFIGLHVVSGWMIMWKTKAPWDKEKWFKTSMKLLWFPVVILTTKWLKHVYEIDFPIGQFVAGFLSVNEFRGIIDNSGKLMGIDLWNIISDQIDWKDIFSKFKGKKK